MCRNSDPTARDGEIIRLRNRTRALEANGAELLARAEQAEHERDLLAAKVEQIYAVDREAMAMVRAERDALKAAIEELIPRTLNAAADKLHALPETDGAALKGPYWYRQGFTQAAGLLRDWADYPAALDAPESPATAPTAVTAATDAHGGAGEAQEG